MNNGKASRKSAAERSIVDQQVLPQSAMTIEPVIRLAASAGHRADIDDRAAPGGEHRLDERAAASEYAVEIRGPP
jgi:hypothetical protein